MSSSVYPPPFVASPESDSHKQSFIVLHGRGDTGENFGSMLLMEQITDEVPHLQAAFPDVKFVFPTASKRRAKVFNRALLHQWFDLASIWNQDEQWELQLEGLRETTAHVHDLLRQEIAAVGAENVVLWGLSQGCASALIATLTWDGEPFKACVGMCGWLPLRSQLELAMRGSETTVEVKEVVFEQTDKAPEGKDAAQPSLIEAANKYLASELSIERRQRPEDSLRIPIFLGHGVLDEKVPMTLGTGAMETLRNLGFNGTWKEYEGLEHWYSDQMLADIVDFITSIEKGQ